MRPLPHFLIGISAVLMLAVAPAHAVVICVANEIQLQNALDAAADDGVNQNEGVEIRLVEGVYLTGIAHLNREFSMLSTHANAVSILGGFAPACQTRSANPTLTILDGGNATPVLAVIKTAGAFSMDGLTIQRGHSAFIGGGVAINNDRCSAGDCFNQHVTAILLTRLIVQGNHSDGYCGGLFAQANQQQIRVESSLFINNSADLNNGGVCLTGDGGFLQSYANTVADNTSPATTDAIGGMSCGGTSPCQIYNNIFWSNTGAGLWLDSSGAFLAFNDYGMRGGEVPASEMHSLHVNPHFVDTLNGNYRLKGDSPVLAVSTLLLDFPDLYGRPHPASGARDIGAFADTVFTDGSEIAN
ncbi:MAG: hypothetical protein ABIQ70_01425 [Dokdonella sp.]